MNSKERVMCTIVHEEPDKVPFEAWLAPEIADSLKNILNINKWIEEFAPYNNFNIDIALKIVLGNDKE